MVHLRVYWSGKATQLLRSRQLLCRFIILGLANFDRVLPSHRPGGTLTITRWHNHFTLSYLELTLTKISESAPLTTFRINTYRGPVSVDSKPLAGILSPLDATLMKKRGRGSSYG